MASLKWLKKKYREQSALFAHWKLVHPQCMITFVIKQKEPCEARVSSTVPWECKGEIPSHEAIMTNDLNLYNTF